MDIFNIIVGCATIASLIVSLVNASNIIKIKNIIKIDESVNSNQSLNAKDISHSDIKQAGRDIK